VMHVFNKADLWAEDAAELTADPAADGGAGAARPQAGAGLRLSAQTGAGLQALRQALLQAAGWQAAPEGLFTARARHVQALRDTLAHVQAAQAHAAQRDAALDLLAEELRLAHQCLCSITGEFSNEDLLGEIFSRFCIGK
jgi:tRNA modification GTPase